ncbi:MAG: ABC transporter permease subunit, partial [Rhizobiaceae bacterium]|nr:ABC transporter permease subunit [Rhizobiaceae bacterium]
MVLLPPETPAEIGVTQPKIRPKAGSDTWIMRAFMLVIGLYLVVTLALPLYAMLSKSFNTFSFDLARFEIQIDKQEGWSEPINVDELNSATGKVKPEELQTSSDGRLSIVSMIEGYSFRATTRYRLRNVQSGGSFLSGSEQITDTRWHEFSSNDFRRIYLKPAKSIGFDNFKQYFSNPSLFNSIYNSLFIAAISTIITITLAFSFAYAIARSQMRYKGAFRVIAMAPILVPSLLPGIALVYLFGNQGMLNFLMGDQSIYGPIGIIAGSVFFTFPHAMIIIQTALSISDARLYEASDALGASKTRTFFTVTLPGAKYGLISATFVVF